MSIDPTPSRRMTLSANSNDDVIGLIYDAAADYSLWPQVLERLADCLGADIGHIAIKDGATGFAGGIVVRADQRAFSEYLQWPIQKNPLAGTAWSPMGQFLTDQQLAPKEILLGSDYYQGFLRPNGIHAVLTAAIWRQDQARALLGFTRPHGAEEFDTAELQWAQSLAPHLMRAIAISLRLSQTELRAQSAEAVLNRLPHGVILLDVRGRISFLNREADKIIADRDGLSSTAIGLVAARRGDTDALTRAIGKTTGPAADGSALRLERPSGRRSLSVLVVPLRPEITWLTLAPPTTMVVVTDPERGHIPPPERLTQLYGLTPAEAGLAMQLMVGDDVAEIAGQRNISVPTARLHLHRVMAKTGVSRQAELVRLLIREGGGIG